MTLRRPLDLTCGDETETQRADLAGGIALALAHSFKIIDPNLNNPNTEHWERAIRLFDLPI